MALPNWLTVARMGSAPVIALLLLARSPSLTLLALLVFVLAAASDFLDGWLARRLHRASALGAALDPVADKILVCLSLSAIAALAPPAFLHMLPILAILFRELLIGGLREALAGAPAVLSVTRLAKGKTCLQLLAIGLLIASLVPWQDGGSAAVAATPPVHAPLWIAGVFCLWLSAVLSLLSGWGYVARARAALGAGGKLGARGEDVA